MNRSIIQFQNIHNLINYKGELPGITGSKGDIQVVVEHKNLLELGSMWVDQKYGNSHSLSDYEYFGTYDTPASISGAYKTITEAINVAQKGDTIQVLPGNYPEDTICIPENVTLVGVGGYEVTTISGSGVPGSASDSFGYFDSPNTRVIMSPNSTLQNFTIVCPSSSGAAGILYDHELPYTCGVRFLKLIGSASTTEGYPSGSGIGPDGIRIKGGEDYWFRD